MSTTEQTHQQDSCTNPDDMNYEALAKRARYFKQDEKGVAAMCKIMEPKFPTQNYTLLSKL